MATTHVSADAPGTMGTQSNWKRLDRWGRRTIGAGLSGGVMVALPALLAGAAPANAAALAVPRLLVAASPSTTVGLQIFANVNLMNAAQPTGTLTFRLFGPADASCTSAPVFVSTVPVTGTSVNSQRFTSDRAGTWRWTASYSGDEANTAAGPTSCAEPAAAVIVDKARTVLSVAALPEAGGSIRASARLSGGVAPTGRITFSLSPPGDTFCNSQVFTSTVDVGGAGDYRSAAYTPSATGTYKWRAAYTGDANNRGVSITSCLDPGAAVTVTSVAPGPAPTSSTSNTTAAPPTTLAAKTAATPAASPSTTTAASPAASPATTGSPATARPAAGVCAILQVLRGPFAFAGDLVPALLRAAGCSA